MTTQETITVEKPLTKYQTCISCGKKEMTHAFFCDACFKKPFMNRLAIYQRHCLATGFNNNKQSYVKFHKDEVAYHGRYPVR